MADPVARSPVPPTAPTRIVSGWEVSDRRSDASLRLADVSPLAKLHVRAHEDGAFAAAIEVEFLHTARDQHGVLVTGSGPGEWTLFGPVGSVDAMIGHIAAIDVPERVTIVDVTHGRALLRLTGDAARVVLAVLCAIDLDDEVVPDGTCLRSSVAGVVTDVVRDDRAGERSYLLHCERSSGAYLADQLADVGQSHGLDVEGFLAATD